MKKSLKTLTLAESTDEQKQTCHCEEHSDEAISVKEVDITQRDCHTSCLWHSVRNDMKKAAFTLAETLITLMVIGVVAALTIPSLMQSYRDRQLATAKTKAMSTISNGFKLMIANNDGVTDALPLLQCGDDFNCLSEIFHKSFQIGMDKTKTHEGLVEKYTKSGDSTDEAGFVWDDVNYIFTTSDGMTYGYLSGFDVVVDLNGDKSPNKICKDVVKLSYGNGTVKDKEEDGTTELCEGLNDGIETASSGNWWETPCDCSGGTCRYVSCYIRDDDMGYTGIFDAQGRESGIIGNCCAPTGDSTACIEAGYTHDDGSGNYCKD